MLTNPDDSWVFVDGVEGAVTEDEDDEDEDDEEEEEDDDDDDDDDDIRGICPYCNNMLIV